ncbi:MAG: hypothetical protein WCT53_04620 [Candidatus Gracilibacteria bacterium]|jgi:hypothetical protein
MAPPEAPQIQPEALDQGLKSAPKMAETRDASAMVEVTDNEYKAKAKSEVVKADAQVLAMKDKIVTTKKQEGTTVS